jgi:predicted site-specific integrase-resolvase
MSDDAAPPELFNTVEVAAIFRVSHSTVTSWCSRGLLPYTTTPTGHFRFYRHEIERTLRRNHQHSAGGSVPQDGLRDEVPR